MRFIGVVVSMGMIVHMAMRMAVPVVVIVRMIMSMAVRVVMMVMALRPQ